jgi:4-hydroxy-tetrahydrodipicolinate synthase
MADFGELITAMITPFNKDFSINYGSCAKIIEHLIANGSESILLSGTTGESPTLTDDEKIELFKFAKKNYGTHVKFIAGTGSNDTRHSAEMSKKAEDAGADGILLVSPYYNKPSQEGLYNHFKEVAQSVQIPVIIYNIPSRTACNISTKTCVELSKIKNIHSVKEASSDFKQIAEIIRDTEDDFLVYSGNDGDTLPLLSLGAFGVISVASHIIGSQIKEMIKVFKNKDIEKAAAMHRDYLDIFYGIFIETNPIPIKAALHLMGIDAGTVRPPLTNMEKNNLEVLKKMLKKYDLI